MFKPVTIASIGTLILLLWMVSKAVSKGIRFDEPWRILAAISIFLLICFLMFLNHQKSEEKGDN